jgi:hypothetical protein
MSSTRARSLKLMLRGQSAAKEAGAGGVEIRPDGTIFVHLSSSDDGGKLLNEAVTARLVLDLKQKPGITLRPGLRCVGEVGPYHHRAQRGAASGRNAMMSRAIDPSHYLTEVDVTDRWPMLTAKELRKARRHHLIEFYGFKKGPCYTAAQVQSYIDRTYLKVTTCDAPSQQTSQPSPLPPQPPTVPSKLVDSISTGPTQHAGASSMPAGMTPALASSAVALLAQRIGKRRRLPSLPSSFPPRPPKMGQSPVLIKS